MQILKQTKLKAYRKAKQLGSEEIIKLVSEKGLTGRAGAGFPTGKKWEMVREQPGKEKYLICNADEGEPGTFKDRFIIENNPETLVEGILIAAYAINAEKAYVYLRNEYTCFKNKLQKAVKEVLKKAKSDLEIKIFVGAGSYVVGEETAILESISGMRGQAMIRPPYPTTKGLFGKPTVINNVETLTNVPLLILYDKWDKNLKLHSLSGNVTKPGVYELKIGTKLKDVIKLGEPKHKIKAIYFGCFGGCIPYEQNKDTELTPENICKNDCILGSHTIIAVDEKQSIVDIATNISKFYEFESCGKCTPCREGTMRVLSLLRKISMGMATREDMNTLLELAEVVKETSFCGLGQTSMNHLLTAVKYFRKEFEEKLTK